MKKSSFSEAKEHVATGYNSPFRSFNLVGGEPIFMKSGKGSKIKDINDKEYIDYSLAWGPLILGHTNKKVSSVIKKVSSNGWCLGTPTEYETEFAKLIKKFFPSMERIRLTNSGTEAIMGAIRIARGYKNKEKIVIFKGNYHGHSNDTLVKSETELSSSGVPRNILSTTLIADYNSIVSVESLLKQNQDIAGVLIEPIPTNMGLILPKNNFLKDLRTICDKYNCLLIFDEVVSGFRASSGGAQQLYNITPDITVLGKALAGGLPVGAFGGKKEIMDKLSPDGEVYTAGTFSGNPMTVLCGIETLKILYDGKLYEQTKNKTQILCNSLIKFIKINNLPVNVNYLGSMFSIFFTTQKDLTNLSDVSKCDFKTFAEYFNYLLKNGIYLSPSGEDTSFLSMAHSDKDVEYTSKIIIEFLTKKYLK